MTGHPNRDGRGLARIRAFAAVYHIDAEERPATASEKRLIETALVDYLLGEEWPMGLAKHEAAAAVRALDSLSHHLPPIARPCIKSIEWCLIDLAERLDRREEANVILYEQLVASS